MLKAPSEMFGIALNRSYIKVLCTLRKKGPHRKCFQWIFVKLFRTVNRTDTNVCFYFEKQFDMGAENGSSQWYRQIIRQVTLLKNDIASCFFSWGFWDFLVHFFSRHLWTCAYLYLVLRNTETCTVQDNVAIFLIFYSVDQKQI